MCVCVCQSRDTMFPPHSHNTHSLNQSFHSYLSFCTHACTHSETHIKNQITKNRENRNQKQEGFPAQQSRDTQIFHISISLILCFLTFPSLPLPPLFYIFFSLFFTDAHTKWTNVDGCEVSPCKSRCVKFGSCGNTRANKCTP